ncbi:MAG TPA: ABC transporter substrate-binding protein, partial [Acidimicrobiia bacterium]|nr:ABC transporter substrate-binding protein [Acidimicrobiia bacterium]
QIVYTANSSLAQPDFTSECLGARNAGAEVIHLIMDVNSTYRIAASCARQGYHPIFALGGHAQVDDVRKDPNLEGSSIAMNVAPWFLETTPAMAEFHQALRTYAPGAVPQPSMMIGWVAAKVFERAAANLPDAATPEAVLDGLWSIKDYDIGGLTYPLTYVRDKISEPRVCWYGAIIQGGQWVDPDGGKRSCR